MSKPRIEVVHESGDAYRVTVHASVSSSHRVVVTPAALEKLAPDGVAAERLIEESFRFLLEREPNTSVLRSFELPVIGRYFPEYEAEILGRLQ